MIGGLAMLEKNLEKVREIIRKYQYTFTKDIGKITDKGNAEKTAVIYEALNSVSYTMESDDVLGEAFEEIIRVIKLNTQNMPIKKREVIRKLEAKNTARYICAIEFNKLLKANTLVFMASIIFKEECV